MKRYIIKVLSAVMLIGCLDACGACGEQTAGHQPPYPGAKTSVEDDGVKPRYPIVDEPITVTVLLHNGQDTTHSRLTWELLSEVTGIRFSFQGIEREQLPAFLAAGEWPDLFHDSLDETYINDYGNIGKKFVDYNILLDHMPNLRKTFEVYPNSLKAVTETDGSIYQLPVIVKAVTGVASRVYYRKDNLREVGLEMPNTIEEFYNALKILRENQGDYPLVPGAFRANETTWFENWIFPAFGDGINPDFEDRGDGNVRYNRISLQYKNNLKFLHRLYAEELLHPEFLTLDGAAATALMKEGRAVISDGPGQGLVEADFRSGEVELGVLAPLTSEFTDIKKAIGYPYVLRANLAINATSEYAVEIAKALDIAYAWEDVVPGVHLRAANFTYGAEGDTWKWANEERTEYELIVPAEHGGISMNEYQYSYLIYGNVGREDTWERAVTVVPGNSRARQLGFRENVLPYQEESPFPSLKFSPGEQAVIDGKFVDILAFHDEMRAKFITGIADIDTGWDDYVNTINQMGLPDILAVYQAAYDRWNGE